MGKIVYLPLNGFDSISALFFFYCYFIVKEVISKLVSHMQIGTQATS